MKKRRSDIAKLVTAARDIWRHSQVYSDVKRESRDPNRTGFYICKKCKGSREVIKIDHIKPIGKQPDYWEEFGIWLGKLNCLPLNLQPLCADCHKEKTKKDAKEIKLALRLSQDEQ